MFCILLKLNLSIFRTWPNNILTLCQFSSIYCQGGYKVWWNYNWVYLHTFKNLSFFRHYPFICTYPSMPWAVWLPRSPSFFLFFCFRLRSFLPSNSLGSNRPSHGSFPYRPQVTKSDSLTSFPQYLPPPPSSSFCLQFLEVCCFCWFFCCSYCFFFVPFPIFFFLNWEYRRHKPTHSLFSWRQWSFARVPSPCPPFSSPPSSPARPTGSRNPYTKPLFRFIKNNSYQLICIKSW